MILLNFLHINCRNSRWSSLAIYTRSCTIESIEIVTYKWFWISIVKIWHLAIGDRWSIYTIDLFHSLSYTLSSVRLDTLALILYLHWIRLTWKTTKKWLIIILHRYLWLCALILIIWLSLVEFWKLNGPKLK